MITKKTVLVLGAGASMAYGLPSGPELKAKVVHQLSNTGTIAQLEQFGHANKFINRFRGDLTESHPPSIDAYLAIREDYIDIGKQAIAATLIPLEEQQELFHKWYKPYFDPDATHPDNGHWYQVLCESMEPLMELEKNELAVITFNYDRSLEQYLYTSLRNLYNPEKIAKEEADMDCAKKVKAIPIIHVYGQLGALPWDNSGKPQVPYKSVDASARAGLVLDAANCIEIMPEARQNAPVFNKAHVLIKKADRIYFLGFGFDQTNVQRLLPKGVLKATSTKMYGTFYGLRRHERQFLGDYGFEEVWTEQTLREARRIPTCRFRDQKICDWLRDNTHAQFD